MEAIADTIDALKGSLEWFVQLSSCQGLFFYALLRLPLKFFQHFPKLKRKQNRREGYSQEVCNRFSHIHCIGLVPGQNMRQQIDQWQQQDKLRVTATAIEAFAFPNDVNAIWHAIWIPKAAGRHSKSGVLISKTKQCRIGSKHFCKHLREEHNKCPQNCGITEACC